MTKTRTDSQIVEQAPQAQLPEVLHFGDYRLDSHNEQLWRNQQAVRLTGKALAVLRHLVHHPSQLVSKRELFRAVWADTVVSHSTLTSCIKELRKALEDDAKSPQYIETVHRRGYRFIAPLTTAPSVLSSQFSVLSSEQTETKSSQLTTDNRQLTTCLVGRDTELAHLHRWFVQACSGERQIILVTGEAGIGKTALLDAFVIRVRDHEESQKSKVKSQNAKVSEAQPSVASPQSLSSPAPSLQPLAPGEGVWWGKGQCIEQYGPGEPYMPVLEAFGRLCRGAEKDEMMKLLHRYAPTWLVHMPALLSDTEREALQRQVGGATRDRMLREMAEALEALTVDRPFVLCLEDLQWSDYSTLELLAIIAARSEPARLFVLGTARSFATLEHNHPLKKLRVQLQHAGRYHELTPSFLSAEVIEEYLAQRFATRPLPAGVGQLVHHHSEGNPLFMVNVTDYLEQQGMIAGEGEERVRHMLEGGTIGVPESLRHLIVHHTEQLSAEEQEVLAAASVVGIEFSAATVAAGLGQGNDVIEMQCAHLAQRGQFLQSAGTAEWPDGTVAASYRFIHALYQNVLYERVPPGRRVGVHLRIAERLERAYQSRLAEVAVELGVHFEQGRDFRRAVQYIGQAAQNAMWTYAYQEAIDHLNKAVALLSHFPESPERTQQELALQVGLSLSLMHTRGFAAPEVEYAYKRIRDLSRVVGDSPQRFAALWGLRNFHLLRGELYTGREAAQEFLEFVQRSGMSTLAAEAHLGIGTPLFHLGEFAAARLHLEQSFALYNPQLPQPKVFLTGQDPRASSLSHLAVLLWIMGYPDQARERSHQALALAQETAFPYGRALVSNLAATLHLWCHDFQAVAQHAEAARTFAQECGFVHLLTLAMALQGWALVMQGKSDEGITLIQSGIQRQQAAGVRIGEVSYRLLLADVYRKTDQVESALQALVDAVTAVEQTGEGTFEAELYRLQGELLLAQENQKSKGKNQKSANFNLQSAIPNPQSEAEECFLKAIAIARQQQAKSLELRATIGLTRLWQQQKAQHAICNTQHDAPSMLSEVYSWFSEGFDTPDLREAKTLLAELQAGS
jgi:DNA-binding winged helix-turn-helix (wHTH) protein/tetratricopeptide (TPR) repeat protein